MGLHQDLEIFKAAYELLGLTFEIVRNAHRDVKPLLVRCLLEPCLELTALIQDANIAEDKTPHLYQLLRLVKKVEIMLRTSHERKAIPTRGFGPAIDLTTSIGKMAVAWKRKFSPVA